MNCYYVKHLEHAQHVVTSISANKSNQVNLKNGVLEVDQSFETLHQNHLERCL